MAVASVGGVPESVAGVLARIQQIRAMVGSARTPATGPEITPGAPPGGVAGFGAVLAASRDPAPPAGSGPAVAAAIRATHPNGNLPPGLLRRTVSGVMLAAPAAEAFDRMVAAAAADGVRIAATDGYRDLATQRDLAARKGIYGQGGLAAVPGTSQHGWGLAVDVTVTPAVDRWLEANAARFGWVRDTPGEPWHLTWYPG